MLKCKIISYYTPIQILVKQMAFSNIEQITQYRLAGRFFKKPIDTGDG
jgi:hypothetical protein